MTKNPFSTFTNLYPVQKTLRRELKTLNADFQPDASLTALWAAEIPSQDQQREADYQAIKPLLDELHHQFISESLQAIPAQNWSDFVSFYQDYQQKKKRKADLDEKTIKTLDEDFKTRTWAFRKAIGEAFAATAEQRKANPAYCNEKGKAFLSQKSYKILTEQGILSVLEQKYADQPEKLELIRRFGNFFTYFTGFNQNRENYYSTEEKSTAVAYRTINQNLLTFANNCELFKALQVLDLSAQEQKVFTPDSYSDYLVQEGIQHYNEQIASIKSKINLYIQQHKTKLPQPKELYKQIGAPVIKQIPFDLINNDEEFLAVMEQFIEQTNAKLPLMEQLFAQLSSGIFDLNQLFFSKSALNQLSNRYFANRHLLLEKGVELKLFKYQKNAEESYKLPAYVSLAQLKVLLESLPATWIQEGQTIGLFKTQRAQEWISNWETLMQALQSDFSSFCHGTQERTDEEGKTHTLLSYNAALGKRKVLSKFEKNNQEQKNLIKAMGDSALGALRMLKRLKIDTDKLGFVPEGEFYHRYDEILEEYPLPKRYDMIRAYLTQKPYSQKKLKLNFNYSNFFQSNSRGHYALIFREKENYYLGIVPNNTSAKKQIKNIPNVQNKNFEMMTYRQIKFQTLSWKWYIRDHWIKYSEDPNAVENLQKTIKESYIMKYPELKPLLDLKNIEKKEFDARVREIITKTYSMDFNGIDKKFLVDQIQQWNIFLFQISSKDFSGKSSTPDLQTLYRKQIFKPWSNIKLNGNAEIFLRKASFAKEKKTLKHDNFEVIKHRRYTEDKLLFHVPITLWFWNSEISPKAPSQFNQKLNQEVLIPHFDDLHVIGVDRGEKHLAFYSIVHAKTGKLVKQGTLNLINGVDYEQKLKEKANSRLQARQNRDTIEKIADLKEGYISQVVKKLTDLMLEYNAVIVFEDLNGGFKRGRQKIEHSVYQKLELALAKKLSCLIRKETPMGEPGSVVQPYQLAPAITTFGDIKGKQRGTIFYTRANYTSTTDPLTGWRKQHYFKKASAEEMKKQFITIFQNLHRDGTAYVFDDGTWQLYSNVERWRGKRNDHWQRIPTKYDPTAELDQLFRKYQIEKADALLAQLKDRDLPQAFWLSLFRILDLIMQIRNTDDQGRDIILSPVGKEGERFDSRQRYDQLPHNEQGEVIEESALPYPTSGDANGAYNIARKGVMMLERIKEYPEKPDLLIRDSEWDS